MDRGGRNDTKEIQCSTNRAIGLDITNPEKTLTIYLSTSKLAASVVLVANRGRGNGTYIFCQSDIAGSRDRIFRHGETSIITCQCSETVEKILLSTHN